MPIDSMASAPWNLPRRKLPAASLERSAVREGRTVRWWPSSATAHCSIAKTTAIAPSAGCSSAAAARYTSIHGRSRKAGRPLPVANWRRWIRSASGRGPARLGCLSAACRLASKTRGPSARSMRRLVRTSRRLRRFSLTAIVTKSSSVTSDTASSVSSL